MKTNRRILVIDVGGTHVNLLVTGMKQPILIPSGPTMTPRAMVRQVKAANIAAADRDKILGAHAAAILSKKRAHAAA